MIVIENLNCVAVQYFVGHMSWRWLNITPGSARVLVVDGARRSPPTSSAGSGVIPRTSAFCTDFVCDGKVGNEKGRQGAPRRLKP
jgi:hypothetical protein